MKLEARAVEGFLKRPDPAIRAVLLYGSDSGLIRERATGLMRSVVPDLGDPFRVVEVSERTLIGDPARLADEAAAIAFTGGRRAIRVTDAGDAIAGLFERFLADPMGDALIVVEAADLARRSKLVGAFEAAEGAVAIGCYPDEGAGLERLIRAVMSEHGLEVSGEAVAYLTDHLGGDRMVSRSELEKLALYCRSAGRVELKDATAQIGDSAGISLDDIAVAVIEGDVEELARSLAQLRLSGVPAITALRSVARHLQRLQLVAASVAAGENPAAAVRSLRPPVYFRIAASLERQARRWSKATVAQSLDRLTQAEAQCKSTGTPAEAVAGQALFALAYRSQRSA